MNPQPLVSPVQVLRVRGGSASPDEDLVVTEEPLEIRLGYGPAHDRQQKSISVTMRSPGHDLELAAGFLFTEGIIRRHSDIAFLEHCQQVAKPEELGNVVKAELREGVEVDLDRLSRNFYTSSSCGVCGKASLEAVEAQGCAPLPLDGPKWMAEMIHALPARALEAQVVFRHTGGIHAATLMDVDGRALFSREDIGRHNAVDKVVGAMLAQGGVDAQRHLLFLSGRAGFELVQKAVMAGIPVLASVGAPSSLSVALAQRCNLTLLGFVREQRFNIYTAPERILL